MQTSKIDKVIARRFTSSSMSDSKWRKTFRHLSSLELGLSAYLWKFVDDERIFQTGIPGAEDLAEKHLKDSCFQPFTYKEIDWIEVETNDVQTVIDSLWHMGNFDCHTVINGIRIYGYR